MSNPWEWVDKEIANIMRNYGEEKTSVVIEMKLAGYRGIITHYAESMRKSGRSYDQFLLVMGGGWPTTTTGR